MGGGRVIDGDQGFRFPVQTPSEESGLSLRAYTALGFATLYAAHVLLRRLDLGTLSPLEIAWNVFVYIIPVRLIAVLASLTHNKDAQIDASSSRSYSEQHAMKGDALRHLLRINTTRPVAQEAGKQSLRSRAVSNTLSKVPPGLGNWDHSCYQNSILQGLASLPSVVDYLDAPVQNTTRLSNTTTASLRELMQNLTSQSNNGKRFWTPSKLKSMSSWQQQDAQEYYSRVLDDVDKELRRAILEDVSNNGLKAVGGDLEKTPRIMQSSDTARLDAHAIPLQGLLGQRVACIACGYSEGLSLLPFNCLTVSLGARPSYAIEDLLDDYTKLEHIEGVECLSCTFTRHAKRLEAMLSPPKGDDSVSTSDGKSETTSRNPGLPPAVVQQMSDRLRIMQEAINDHDFSDKTATKCAIGKDARVSSTKTKQVVIARAPQALAVHINRSIFDEMTGALAKNLARVTFPPILTLRPWTIGHSNGELDAQVEQWPTDPNTSLADRHSGPVDDAFQYELKAVVAHFGRHENGHYYCYRQHNRQDTTKGPERLVSEEQNVLDTSMNAEQWWRLSDDNVTRATEDEVLHQGGVFMLFYEKLPSKLPDREPPMSEEHAAETAAASVEEGEVANLEVVDSTSLSESINPPAKAVAKSTASIGERPVAISTPTPADEPELSPIAASATDSSPNKRSPNVLRTAHGRKRNAAAHASANRQIVAQ